MWKSHVSLQPSLSIHFSVWENRVPILLPDWCLWNQLKVSANRCPQSTGLGRAVLSQCRPPRSGSVVGEGEGRILLESCHNMCSAQDSRTLRNLNTLWTEELHEQWPQHSSSGLHDHQQITDKYNLPVHSLLLESILLFSFKKKERKEGGRESRRESETGTQG